MKKVIYIFVLIVAFTSCVKDSNYETPQINCEEPQIPVNQLSSIQNVIAQWNAANPTGTTSNIVEFVTDTEGSVYISGYVTSDDQTGNFYKELFIQDAPKDPQYAVKILIDVASLYTKFDVGRKVFIKLNGLAINKVRGEIVIGELLGGAISELRENRAKINITRSCNVEAITPKTVTIADINSSLVGMYVKLENMQFDQDLIGTSFVNPLDSYDSYRTMVSCVSGELLLETSTFASFKSQILPAGMGSVHGIITRNYANNAYVLRVNDPNVFVFNGQRCDPLFKDGFSNGFGKWTTHSVVGAQVWVIDTQYGNPGNCAKMSGYSGSNQLNEDWLITKSISLAGLTSATLTFQSARNYSGNNLVTMVSTNFDGVSNPNTATWVTLNPVLSTSGFAWTNSGNIDLTPYVGQTNVKIGFKYTSTTSGAATYEIDNVKIEGLK